MGGREGGRVSGRDGKKKSGRIQLIAVSYTPCSSTVQSLRASYHLSAFCVAQFQYD